MKTKRLCMALVLGVGLMLGLVWLLGSGTVARAASIDVTTTTSGLVKDLKCSLREAIIAANTDTKMDTCGPGDGDDVITLEDETYILTLSGTDEDAALTGDLDITSTLTILGAGPGETIIDANGIDRVFEIHEGAGTVVISGVTIYNGNVTGLGGGICSHDADLTLINVEVVSNTAGGLSPDGRGGGVFVEDGTLLLDGAQILSNTASMLGGGVLVSYPNCVFTQTGGTTIAHNHTDGDGGGVAIEWAKATISGGRVYSNTAGGDGGGIAILYAKLSMDGVDVVENLSQADGGGVYVQEGGVTLNGGQILSNTADDEGGGIYVTSGGAFTQTGATLIARNTSFRGGGVYVNYGRATLSGGQIVSNTADTDGGGVYNGYGTVTLVNTTISRNDASNGSAIYNDDTITLTFTTVASNTAEGGSGGIHNTGNILVQNTIVAHNSPANCTEDALTSNGYNMEDTDTCGFDDPVNDHPDTDPKLAPLAEDSGTLIHALMEGSPAIEGGVCIDGITTDQRGMARREGITCDIGAYEYPWLKVFLPLVLKD